jgi:hypothetical protein
MISAEETLRSPRRPAMLALDLLAVSLALLHKSLKYQKL